MRTGGSCKRAMSKPTPLPIAPVSKPSSVISGVTFGQILRHVMKHLRMTETKATFCVSQVLRSGMAMKRIEKTEDGRYRLLHTKPPGLVCKIKEMKTSDDEDRGSDCSSASE